MKDLSLKDNRKMNYSDKGLKVQNCELEFQYFLMEGCLRAKRLFKAKNIFKSAKRFTKLYLSLVKKEIGLEL